ncbi:hypothetical protein ABZ667_44250 [Streptomyces lavendulae]|uniref:hypothetical protein n=1 Tax=Streptomyces lavendulae TaxID=1914 RepID=UPI0033D4E50A
MKVLEKIATLLGVGGDRSAPPPTYAGIADGLVLTEGDAWAWSPYSADDYRAEAADMYRVGRWQEWAEHRAVRLDQIALPIRHVLLGVRLGARKVPAGRRVTDAAGVTGPGEASVAEGVLSGITAPAREAWPCHR